MAFVASSIASSRLPFAKETPARFNNSSEPCSAGAPAKATARPRKPNADHPARARRIRMGNGYRPAQNGASPNEAMPHQTARKFLELGALPPLLGERGR